MLLSLMLLLPLMLLSLMFSLLLMMLSLKLLLLILLLKFFGKIDINLVLLMSIFSQKLCEDITEGFDDALKTFNIAACKHYVICIS